MDEPATIRVRGVGKRFGDLRALDGIDLDVAPGQIVGLLGHNGAGKTTLLRVINGLYRPEAGEIAVAGRDPVVEGSRVRALTGVLTEYPALDDYLSPRELLAFYARVHGVEKATARGRIDDLLDRFELPGDPPCRELSAGLKQRVALVRALVHDPPVLLLDEPTTNMDPLAARDVRDMIRGLSHDEGKTVLLSTHNLSEAQQLCDRVAIMRRGVMLIEGTPDTLRRQLTTRLGVRLTCATGQVETLLAALRPVTNGNTSVDGATVAVHGAVDVPDLVRRAVRAEVAVHRVEPLEDSLEEVYVCLHADEEEARP